MELRALEKLTISDSGEIPHIFWYPKPLHPIIKVPLINPIPNTINPVHTPHFIYSHSLIHTLTPCSTALLEKLTGSQLVKKFPAFYGTRRLIIAVTSVIPFLNIFLKLCSHLLSVFPSSAVEIGE
jgi:hypothetical protein